MGHWIGRLGVIRTTYDASGLALGIVTGMGATPGLAQAELRREAESLLQREAAADLEVAEEEWKKKEKAYRAALQYQSSHMPPPKPGDAGVRVAALRLPGRQPSLTEPEERRFEVVDVHLTPYVMEGGGSGWLASGTLVQEGVS